MADKYVIAKRAGLVAVAVSVVIAVILWLFCWLYPETTVIVLRHAERAGTATPADDHLDPLTPDGNTRAQELAQVLERVGVSAIYVTQAVRTQQTAQPLANSRSITPTQYVYGSDSDIDNLITEVRSRRNRGRVIVIVGHSDTVPKIVDKLRGGTVAVGSQFDNLFVLTVPFWGSAKLIKATYGAPR